MTYAYDGLGDRLQMTVGGHEVPESLWETTTYTLDLASDLSQVLDDGTNAYLYAAPTGSAVHLAQVNATTVYPGYRGIIPYQDLLLPQIGF